MSIANAVAWRVFCLTLLAARRDANMHPALILKSDSLLWWWLNPFQIFWWGASFILLSRQ